MIVGEAPVEQNGLLDQPLPQNLREEINVGLGGSRTNRDVVEPGTWIIKIAHDGYLGLRNLQLCSQFEGPEKQHETGGEKKKAGSNLEVCVKSPTLVILVTCE